MVGTILTDDRSSARTLTLDRLECLNALNPELRADFCMALDDALADEQVGALILRGAGQAFCSGGLSGSTLRGVDALIHPAPLKGISAIGVVGADSNRR